jgi:hypothetical protein
MSMQIVMTAKEKAEFAAMEARLPKRPPAVLGICPDCRRPLPVGYMPVVTKWKSVRRGDIAVQVPEVCYCQQCGKDLGHRKPKPAKAASAPVAAPQAPAVSPVKVLAIKLLKACSDVPHGSNILCKIAGIERSELIVPILRKLRDAGKVIFEEGKWTRA